MAPKSSSSRNESSSNSLFEFNGFTVSLPPEDSRDRVLTAIVKAILHSGRNTPCTPKEITAIIMTNDYAHLGGLTPHATISSRISTHFKRCNESGGSRVPLLGRLASESNNRKIKYYVDQLPFELNQDDDYTIMMKADEPAKPVARATSPRPASHRSSQARRNSADSVSIPHKRKNSGAVAFRKKRKKADSSSEEENEEDYDHSQELYSPKWSTKQVISGPSSGDGKEGNANDIQLDSDFDDDDSMRGEPHSYVAAPPLNPHQTYAFSPVLQPHIFMRPNSASLPPLSTLQQPSVISHLSPPLISASPAIRPSNGSHSGMPSRLFIPSPILLPSPRGLVTTSPPLGHHIQPLDLGLGVYTNDDKDDDLHDGKQNGPSGSGIVERNPETISIGELDEIFLEHDRASNKGKRKRTISSKSRKLASVISSKKPTNQTTRASIANAMSKSESKEEIGIHKKAMPSLAIVDMNSKQPTFEIAGITLNLTTPVTTSTFNPLTRRNSGQFVAVSKMTACPVVSMSLHVIKVTESKAWQLPTEPINVDLKNYIRIGELIGFYNELKLFTPDSLELEPNMIPRWTQFCKQLLQVSTAKNPERPPSPDGDEIDAAMSLMGLVSKSRKDLSCVSGGTSFAICVKDGADHVNHPMPFSSELIIVVIKTQAIGNPLSRCHGIWIPPDIAKFVVNLLHVPTKFYQLFDDSYTAQPRRLSQSASSVNSSKYQNTRTENDGETEYLKFDESDEDQEEIDVGTEAIPQLSEVSTHLEISSDLTDSLAVSLLPSTSIDPSGLTLVPASNLVGPSCMLWMTTIDGVFVYITWVGNEPVANIRDTSPSSATDISVASQQPSGTGIPILRRVDNGMVNASQLLHAGGVTSEQEKSVIISLERIKKRYRRPDSDLRGTWIPLARARDLARTLSLHSRLGPFLDDDAGEVYFGVMGPMRQRTKAASSESNFTKSLPRFKKSFSKQFPKTSPAAKSSPPAGSVVPGFKSGDLAAFSTPAFHSQASSPRTNIYPPGSLAAIKYARTQQQITSKSVTEAKTQQNISSQKTPSNILSTDSGAKLQKDDLDLDRIEAPPKLITRTEKIAAAESATRTAIAALANTLAQTTRSNPTILTPPVIAATLAAFATGAKKINDAVRNVADEDAYINQLVTPGMMLQAFANSVKQRGTVGVILTNSIADGQFPAINLASVSGGNGVGGSKGGSGLDLWAHLGSSIESTARTASAVDESGLSTIKQETDNQTKEEAMDVQSHDTTPPAVAPINTAAHAPSSPVLSPTKTEGTAFGSTSNPATILKEMIQRQLHREFSSSENEQESDSEREDPSTQQSDSNRIGIGFEKEEGDEVDAIEAADLSGLVNQDIEEGHQAMPPDPVRQSTFKRKSKPLRHGSSTSNSGGDVKKSAPATALAKAPKSRNTQAAKKKSAGAESTSASVSIGNPSSTTSNMIKIGPAIGSSKAITSQPPAADDDDEIDILN